MTMGGQHISQGCFQMLPTWAQILTVAEKHTAHGCSGCSHTVECRVRLEGSSQSGLYGWCQPDKTLITPAPVCANMIQILVHTYRGLGCSIFVEINVKRQSNPSPFNVLNILHCSANIQPSTISSKYHFKKCVPFRHNSRGLLGLT